MIPNVGKKEILVRILNGIDKCNLHLYKTDKVLALTDVVSTYVEVAGAGYSPISLSSLWIIKENTASYVELSFDLNAAATAYGYYVTNSANTIVLFSERFGDGPYTTQAIGGSIKVTPSIQLD
jgi:hypothetical protein